MTLAQSALSLEAQAHEWDLQLDAGTVTLAGTDYTCPVTVGPIEPDYTGDGIRSVQSITFTILKAALSTRPALSAAVVHAGLNYDITSIAGDQPQAINWTIKAKREVS